MRSISPVVVSEESAEDTGGWPCLCVGPACTAAHAGVPPGRMEVDAVGVDTLLPCRRFRLPITSEWEHSSGRVCVYVVGARARVYMGVGGA
jgi:hypothetical protein